MSRSNREVAAIILAGGHGEKLSILSEKRAIPSVPFAGKYRIIDFTLSNCVNSGIFQVLVLTQYRPLSLHDHIGSGKPWDLDRLHGGVRILSPYLGRKEAGWDKGTADAVYQNIDELRDMSADHLMILGSDHVYRMDYRNMINLHLEKNADVTVSVHPVPQRDAHRFGIVAADAEGRVTQFQEKPHNPRSNLASMGIYIFKKDFLLQRLSEDAASNERRHDFGRDVLPDMVDRGDRVFAYNFEGYWQDVGTIQSYWEAHMGLVQEKASFDLYERKWVIYTRSEERPPAVTSSDAFIERSLISHGCQIRGRVINSVLSPGVIVEEGAEVRHSVIMVDTVIEKNAVVDRAIIDKEVRVGAGSVVGYGDDNTPNRKEPSRLNTGITIVGKKAIIPEGIRIGRNCMIGTDVTPDDFPRRDLVSGESVESGK